MITYNNIIGRFEQFVKAHYFLKTFTHGSPSGVDLEKFEVYPAMHVVYTGATYEDTSKEYSFEVYILDLPPDKSNKVDNQTQLVSNAEQAAEDILADMRNGNNIFDFGHLYTVTSATTTPLEEAESNSLSGVLLNISIEVGYTLDACNAPFKGGGTGGSIIPSSGTGAMSTVFYTTTTNTTFTAGGGAVALNLPQATGPAAGNSVWTTVDINLNKSLSYLQNPVNNRHEFFGLNSSAVVNFEAEIEVTVTGAGVVLLTTESSGVFIVISEQLTFAGSGTQSATLSGTGTNIFASYLFNGLKVLGTVGGTATLKSVRFTVNNQF